MLQPVNSLRPPVPAPPVASPRVVERFPIGLMWGKQHGLSVEGGVTYSLIAHLVDAAAAAQVVIAEFCTPGQRAVLSRGGVDPMVVAGLLAGWHDVGKAMPGWQRPHAPWIAERFGVSPTPAVGAKRVSHQTAGFWHLLEGFHAQGVLTAYRMSTANMLAQVVGGHHGIFPNTENVDALAGPTGAAHKLMDENAAAHAVWRAHRDDLMRAVGEVLGAPENLLAGMPKDLTAVQGSLLTGVVILADWLMSQVSIIRPVLGGMPDSAEGWTPERTAFHFEGAKIRALVALNAAGLTAPVFPLRPFGVQFPGYAPMGAQLVAVNLLPGLVKGPGMWVVMAPTGDGKTEAGLHAASVMAQAVGATGFAFTLPTMATTDAMYRRNAQFLVNGGDPDARLSLMHSGASLNSEYTSRSKAALAVGADLLAALSVEEPGSDPEMLTDDCHRQALDDVTQYVVGNSRTGLAGNSTMTIDQLLKMALRVKYQPLTLLGVSRKVVIIDEAHAYDPYMQVLLLRTIEWLGASSVPVVVMSATLSEQMAKDLVGAYRKGVGFLDIPVLPKVAYPGWLYVDGLDGAVKGGLVPATDREREVQIDLTPYLASDGWDYGPLSEAVLAQVIGLLRADNPLEGNMLVLCNTMGEAVAVHTLLRAWADAGGGQCLVWLMHSRFPKGQRVEHAEQAECWYGRGSRAGETPTRPIRSILVATQVVEASLDLCMDFLVTDLAPGAQLVQRLGRQHRHLWYMDADGVRQLVVRPAAFVDCRMVVLVPVDKTGALVNRDARPYDHVLLDRTLTVFTETFGAGGGVMRVPQDIQGLMNDINDVLFSREHAEPMLAKAHERASLDKSKRQHAANAVVIPSPGDVEALEELTSTVRAEDAFGGVSARYDMNTVTLLPVWERDGVLFLDCEYSERVPVVKRRADGGAGGLSDDARRRVVLRTVTVPKGAWWPAFIEAQPLARDKSWQHTRSLDSILFVNVSLEWANNLTHPDRDEHTSDLHTQTHTLTISISQGLRITKNGTP